MTTTPPEKQPDAFPTAVAFVFALLPVVVLVYTFFPDGGDCATDPALSCEYWYSHYTSSTMLISAGALVTLVWLILGVKFFVTTLRSTPPSRARQAVFLYVMLTCVLCFLILPTALVSVLIVFVFSEIVLRISPPRSE